MDGRRGVRPHQQQGNVQMGNMGYQQQQQQQPNRQQRGQQPQVRQDQYYQQPQQQQQMHQQQGMQQQQPPGVQNQRVQPNKRPNPQQQQQQQTVQQQMRPGDQGQPPTAPKKPRWFVALFDYDPASMSPNPESCEEELPFTEGENIKVRISFPVNIFNNILKLKYLNGLPYDLSSNHALKLVVQNRIDQGTWPIRNFQTEIYAWPCLTTVLSVLSDKLYVCSNSQGAIKAIFSPKISSITAGPRSCRGVGKFKKNQNSNIDLSTGSETF